MARQRKRIRYTRAPRSRAKLEPVTWTLYDTIAVVNTTVGEQRMFQDAVGQGGKNLLHTNMEKPGSLATPKLFDVRNVYIGFHQGHATLAGAILADDAPGVAPAIIGSSLGLLYTSSFVFHVGEKDYINQATFSLPCNYHLGGGIVPGGDVDVAIEFQHVHAQSVGMGFSVARRRIRLLPDQSFHATLNLHIAGAGVPASGRLVFCGLDGILFREVQ